MRILRRVHRLVILVLAYMFLSFYIKQQGGGFWTFFFAVVVFNLVFDVVVKMLKLEDIISSNLTIADKYEQEKWPKAKPPASN